MRQVRRTGHPIHPALAPAALGLLASGTAFDLLAPAGGGLTWLAFWTVGAGLALGTWSAMWAIFDWVFFAQLGAQGACGLGGFDTSIVLAFYGLASLLRLHSPMHAPPSLAVALEVVGAALLGMKMWFGRELAAWLSDRR